MECNSNLLLSTFEESHLRPRRAISASAHVNITCVHDSSQKRTPSPQFVNMAENYSSTFRDIIASTRIDSASLRAKLCNHDSLFLLQSFPSYSPTSLLQASFDNRWRDYRRFVTRHTATTFDSKNTKECRRAQLTWWLH